MKSITNFQVNGKLKRFHHFIISQIIVLKHVLFLVNMCLTRVLRGYCIVLVLNF